MQQMTRREFEVYEKRVEGVLASVEANVEPSERRDYDEIAAAARDVVDIRREYLELREREAQTPADGRPEADNEAWDRAVTRNGEEVVERGNDAMLEVEIAREAIDRAVYDGRDPSNAEAQLRLELERAARLAVAGNSWIREIAESDQELHQAIDKVERTEPRIDVDRAVNADDRNTRPIDHRTALNDGNGPTAPAANVEPGSADAEAERQGNLLRDAERERMHADSPTHDDQVPVVDETIASRARDAAERTTGSTRSEATPTDPPQQHVPRLQELEREIEERHERERDDRER